MVAAICVLGAIRPCWIGHSMSLPVTLGLVQQLNKSQDDQQLHNTPQHTHVVAVKLCTAPLNVCMCDNPNNTLPRVSEDQLVCGVSGHAATLLSQQPHKIVCTSRLLLNHNTGKSTLYKNTPEVLEVSLWLHLA